MVRKWFGVHQIEDSNCENEKVLNDLLEMFKSALCRYYDYDDKDLENVQHLVSLLKQKNLTKGKELFLYYIEEKMLPIFQMYLNRKMNEDKNIKANIEYNQYILLEEVKTFDYPDDVRATLIGIVSELPDYYNE